MFSSKFQMACVILCSIIVIIKEKRKESEFYRMSFCSTDLALKPSLSFSSAFTLVQSTVFTLAVQFHLPQVVLRRNLLFALGQSRTSI